MSAGGERQVRERNRKTPEAETWMMSWKVQWRRCSAGEGRGWLIWLDTGVEGKSGRWRAQETSMKHTMKPRPGSSTSGRLSRRCLMFSQKVHPSILLVSASLTPNTRPRSPGHYNNLYWVYSSKWTLFCRLWRLTMTEMCKNTTWCVIEMCKEIIFMSQLSTGFDSKPKCCTDDNLQTVVFTSRLK